MELTLLPYLTGVAPESESQFEGIVSPPLATFTTKTSSGRGRVTKIIEKHQFGPRRRGRGGRGR